MFLSAKSFKTQKVYAYHESQKIFGILYTPKNSELKNENGELPAVIFAHGFSSSHRWMKPYAEAVCEKGFAAYIFDFCGGSPYSKSSGKTTEMSVFTEESDLASVIKMISERAEIDKSRIYVAGESQGGAVSAITAAHNENLVRALVLLYPALHIPDYARSLYTTVRDIPEMQTISVMKISRIYYEDVLDYDIFSDIKSYKKPVLIIHGNVDFNVDVSYSRRAAQEYQDARLLVIDGAGHVFRGKHLKLAEKYLIDFLKTIENGTEKPESSPETMDKFTRKYRIQGDGYWSLGAYGVFTAETGFESGETHFSAPGSMNFPIFAPEAQAFYSWNVFSKSPFPFFTFSSGTTLNFSALSESLLASFRPFLYFPFLSFSLGGDAAAGFFDTKIYDIQKEDYESKSAFQNIFYKVYAKAQLDFPLPSSFVLSAQFQSGYSALSGAGASDLWSFSSNAHQHNGFIYAASLSTLRFVPSSRLNMYGVIASVSGNFSDSGLDGRFKNFDGTFKTFSFIPLANFQLGERNSICVFSQIASRRSFSENHEKIEEEPLLKCSGSEWIWSGVYFKYTHNFY